MGSKNRIAKHLLPIMLENRNGRTWVEPFVGGANMIDKADGKRIGSDTHKHLIALHKALQNGWIPPTDVSKEMYHEVKNNQDRYTNELIGFVGFLCSFGGKWWGGYAANSKGDHYAERGSRVLTKQAKKLKGITFKNQDYQDLEIPENSLIYCDPPYEGTTKYKDDFNHAEFWEWCRQKTKEGHQVFISEYNAPEDFKCVKEIQHKTILDKNSNYKRIEKLFVYCG
jgi:DNA adenine methylase